MAEYAREEMHRFASVARPTVLTIGNFDGVHRGHQHLVRFVMQRARERGYAAGAVTLYPDPARVLRPSEPAQYLTSLEERLELLRGLGLDVVLPLTFTSEFAELSPRQFCALLQAELDLKLLIMGPDHAFGRSREATPERVAELGREMGFEVEVMPKALLEAGGAVSSTAIRAALAAGDLPAVESLLGRRYSLRGPVVGGQKLGRELGFPTANIAVTADRALPAFGIYATWAHLGEARYPSATSIGVRPSVDNTAERVSVETFIIDFDGDIYDRQLRIELVQRLRPEEKFDGLEALTKAIAADVARSREILAADQ
jgi:riboflavin kinase/FMN adenylyltransferase